MQILGRFIVRDFTDFGILGGPGTNPPQILRDDYIWYSIIDCSYYAVRYILVAYFIIGICTFWPPSAIFKNKCHMKINDTT